MTSTVESYGKVCFFRYVPVSRINIPHVSDSDAGLSSSFPSLSACDEIEKAPSSTLVRCDFGSVEAVAKVCFLLILACVSFYFLPVVLLFACFFLVVLFSIYHYLFMTNLYHF